VRIGLSISLGYRYLSERNDIKTAIPNPVFANFYYVIESYRECGCRSPRTYLTGDWMGPRVSLKMMAKRKSILLPGIEPRFSNP
jgi:hypothetical protein